MFKCGLFLLYNRGEVKEIKEEEKWKKHYSRSLNRAFICLGITQVAYAMWPFTSRNGKAYAPFNWTQEDDAKWSCWKLAVPINTCGYDVQIAKKVAEGSWVKPLIVKTSWNGLIPALTSGKIDMIIAESNRERKKRVPFTPELLYQWAGRNRS